MEDVPAGQDVAVGSVSAFIEVLHEPALREQLPPFPDWPDLN
jgi:glutaredoxin-related protein